MTIHFIVNPTAGSGLVAQKWPLLKEEIEKRFKKYAISMSERRGHCTELTRKAIRDGARLVVAVGGDGTINEVVNGFFENGEQLNKESEFGIINMGTGSDFARTIQLPRDFSSLLTSLEVTRSIPCDLGLCTYIDHSGNTVRRYFINISDLGIGGEVIRQLDMVGKGLLGKFSYALVSFRTLLRYKKVAAEIYLDDHEGFKSRVISVIVANGRYFGSSMVIAPHAVISDGYFDVVVIGDMTRLGMIAAMRKVYTGDHLDLKKVGFFRAKKVRITAEHPLAMETDGEHLGTSPAVFEVIENAIRIKGQARRYHRIKENVVVRYRLLGKAYAHATEQVVMARDFSIGGMCIEVNELIRLSDQLQIKFNLPNSLRTILAKGRAVRVMGVEEGRYQIGIEFLRISDKDREFIREYVEEAIRAGRT